MCGPHCITHFITPALLSRSTLFLFAIPHFKSHHIGHVMDLARPHLALHPISHYVPHSMYSTPHFRSHHKWPHYALHHHRTTAFHRPFMSRIIASFHHIWPWSHPILHPTTMFHITFHITHPYTTHSTLIPPLTTSRVTPPPLPRIAPCHSHTSFHIAQRSTFHATH